MSQMFGYTAPAPLSAGMFGGTPAPVDPAGLMDPAALMAKKQLKAMMQDQDRMARPDPFALPMTNPANQASVSGAPGGGAGASPIASTTMAGATGLFGVAGRKPGLMGMA